MDIHRVVKKKIGLVNSARVKVIISKFKNINTIQNGPGGNVARLKSGVSLEQIR